MTMWPDAFTAPSRLYGLLGVLGLLVGLAAVSWSRPRYTARFTDLELVDTVLPRRPRWRRGVLAGLGLIGLATLVVAWAQPVDEVLVPRERATVVLAIDTSLSMQATDVEPDRIRAAQSAALDFVEDLPPTINVGLVTFDGIARVRVTPTLDRIAVRTAIAAIELGPSTAIGEAIFAGLDAVASAPGGGTDESVPARIVVMTDGKTTVGRPDADGAQAAVEADIPVSTIAFGTDRGAIVIDGQLQPVPVEVASLRLVAEQTGGRFFRAESLEDLRSVYEDIGSSVGFTTEDRGVADRWSGYALAMLGAAAVLSLLWFQRIP